MLCYVGLKLLLKQLHCLNGIDFVVTVQYSIFRIQHIFMGLDKIFSGGGAKLLNLTH